MPQIRIGAAAWVSLILLSACATGPSTGRDPAGRGWGGSADGATGGGLPTTFAPFVREMGPYTVVVSPVAEVPGGPSARVGNIPVSASQRSIGGRAAPMLTPGVAVESLETYFDCARGKHYGVARYDRGSEIRDLTAIPPATLEEYREAVARVLSALGDLRSEVRAGRAQTYRPMPPVEETAGKRVVLVGVRAEPGSAVADEILGFDRCTGEVTRYAGSAPERSASARPHCGSHDAGQFGEPGYERPFQISVTKDGQPLWDAIVLRPSISTGIDGSGIELRDVRHRGRSVLKRAHAPIVNVQYKEGGCGPYRDWADEENPFQVEGVDITAGIRWASERPATQARDGQDRGNFNGVALTWKDGSLILTSEVEAGWYRYLTEWRLDESGRIRPRFGFGATQDSCVCHKHIHHAYWRLDFDLDASGGHKVAVWDTARQGWKTLRREARRYRATPTEKWKVTGPGGLAYQIVPRPPDGTAAQDTFGRGDLWILAKRPEDDGRVAGGELEDSRVTSNSSAALNEFVNQESVKDADVVLWYGGHFLHATEPDEASSSAGRMPAHDEHVDDPHVFGPDLVPDPG